MFAKRYYVAAAAHGDLRVRDVELWDTGQFPHYDGVYLAGDELEGLVVAILAAPRTMLLNPFYDPDEGSDQ